MGQGGYITLVNGTKYDWNRSYQDQKQMNDWNFPVKIAKGSSVKVYVEWDGGPTTGQYGFANYTLDQPVKSETVYFRVHALANQGFDILIELVNIESPQAPKGTTIDLGWKHDGYVTFVLAGQVGSFTMSGLPAGAWMQENLGVLGNRTLRQLCIPGSHDAGMSEYVPGTSGTHPCNTLTQSGSIGQQLINGARYFDIRPVVTDNKYRTGHYSEAAGVWNGANGQSIPSIIEDVNAFTVTNKELVILHLSHDLNTDLGRSSYAPLTQGDWDYLLGYFATTLTNLFAIPNPARGIVDLSQLTLKEFIGGQRAAVVVIVDPSRLINMEAHENQGFYTPCSLSVADQYADSNDLNTMITDQLTKMRQLRLSPDSHLFLLSWTLTQSANQAINCFSGAADSIKDLAEEANPQLFVQLLNQCTARCYPNILYIDYLQTPDIVAMAMAVNWLPLP